MDTKASKLQGLLAHYAVPTAMTAIEKHTVKTLKTEEEQLLVTEYNKEKRIIQHILNK